MTSAQEEGSKPQQLSDSHRNWILVLASLLLLVQAIPRLSLRWVADESWYSAPAVQLVRHGELRMPAFAETALQGRVETQNPVFVLTLAAAFKLLGTSLYTAKLPSLLCAVAGILLTYLIGCEFRSRLLGVTAAVFLAADSLYVVAARTVRPEAEATVFVLLGILLYLYSARSKSLGLALLSGLVVGIAVQVHPSGLAAGIIAGVLALLEFRASIWRRARPWGFAAGLLLALVPFLLWANSDAVHREEFINLYTSGEQYTLSDIPSLELSRYSDFIGMPNARFRMPVPLPYRLQVVLALLAAAYFLYRYDRALLGKVACLLLPCMFWWAYIRNQGVRCMATGSPYFALLLAGAVLALWNRRPAWRRWVAGLAMFLLLSEVVSNYALIYLYRKADYIQLADRLRALIPRDVTIYGSLPFYMAFQGQPFYSFNRTPLKYALDHGASYLILNDQIMVSGNGFGKDDWRPIREETTQFVKSNATLVGRAPNPYYGDLEIYRVDRPAPAPASGTRQ